MNLTLAIMTKKYYKRTRSTDVDAAEANIIVFLPPPFFCGISNKCENMNLYWTVTGLMG